MKMQEFVNTLNTYAMALGIDARELRHQYSGVDLTTVARRTRQGYLARCKRIMEKDQFITMFDTEEEFKRFVTFALVALDGEKWDLDVKKAAKECGFDELWHKYMEEGDSK